MLVKPSAGAQTTTLDPRSIGDAPRNPLHSKETRPSTTGATRGFDQYHEPPDELPAATRTFARLCASLTEEADAIALGGDPLFDHLRKHCPKATSPRPDRDSVLP